MSACHRAAVVVLVLLLSAGCGETPSAPDGSGTAAYRVSGSATSVSIFYGGPSGNVQVKTTTPWSYSFDATQGTLLYVTASNSTSTAASVTVEIWKKGKLFKTATNSGPYAGASVSGIF